MTIIGIGTDIVDINRLRKARELKRVADFFFRPAEIKDMNASRDKAQFAASRLAIKEAIIKAYPNTLSYHDIEISKRGLKLSAKLIRPADKKYKIFLSIAHEHDYAVSYVILYK